MNSTVILANGDFPREGGVAWNILANAERVVACDGAANAYFAHFNRHPTLTVGDMDSFLGSRDKGQGTRAKGQGLRDKGQGPRVKGQGSMETSQTSQTIKISEQDTNDLAKAVRVCRERGWENPVILGATGKRDDHTLGNIMRAFEFELEVVTDYGRFVPVRGSAKFDVRIGSPMSIFAPDPTTHATSRGLEWPLDNVKFSNLYCATLNRTTDSMVELTTDKTIFAYVPFE